jgi:hypothetical protein
MLKILYYMLYLKFIIEFIICDIWIKFCGDFYSGRNLDLARSRKLKIFVDLIRSRKLKIFVAIYSPLSFPTKFSQNKLLF